MAVLFYKTTGLYGCLSNFSRHGFLHDGVDWPTVEHYFQAQKFAGTERAHLIQNAATPRQAKDLGHDRSVPARLDWDEVKDAVMRHAVLRKFEANDDARAVLLGTGDEDIIEDSPTDYYWGCGADGSGKNMLGRILMDVRALLRQSAEGGQIRQSAMKVIAERGAAADAATVDGLPGLEVTAAVAAAEIGCSTGGGRRWLKSSLNGFESESAANRRPTTIRCHPFVPVHRLLWKR